MLLCSRACATYLAFWQPAGPRQQCRRQKSAGRQRHTLASASCSGTPEDSAIFWCSLLPAAHVNTFIYLADQKPPIFPHSYLKFIDKTCCINTTQGSKLVKAELHHYVCYIVSQTRTQHSYTTIYHRCLRCSIKCDVKHPDVPLQSNAVDQSHYPPAEYEAEMGSWNEMQGKGPSREPVTLRGTMKLCFRTALQSSGCPNSVRSSGNNETARWTEGYCTF